MRINNQSGFDVATMLWEDLQGQAKLSVIVKATFGISAETGASLAERQLPILIGDEHYGKDLTSSVRLESDMVPLKPHCDVVLVGHAYPPGGRPVKELDVSLRVATMEKTIRVFGNRHWLYPSTLAPAPVFSSPEPFTGMNLVYERSYGGIDAISASFCRENLVGRGHIGSKSVDSIHGKPLPNIEDPKNLIRSWDSRPRPVGFGFFGRGWAPRVVYAGTYDEKYRKERAPLLPEDFSYAIFNGAHPDLQVKGYLRGDEEVELVNLSRKPTLRFQLSGMIPKITVKKWAVSPEEWVEANSSEDNLATLDQVPILEEVVKASLDTLVFLPDEEIFYEVFRGVVSLNTLERPEVAEIGISSQAVQ